MFFSIYAVTTDRTPLKKRFFFKASTVLSFLSREHRSDAAEEAVLRFDLQLGGSGVGTEGHLMDICPMPLTQKAWSLGVCSSGLMITFSWYSWHRNRALKGSCLPWCLGASCLPQHSHRPCRPPGSCAPQCSHRLCRACCLPVPCLPSGGMLLAGPPIPSWEAQLTSLLPTGMSHISSSSETLSKFVLLWQLSFTLRYHLSYSYFLNHSGIILYIKLSSFNPLCVFCLLITLRMTHWRNIKWMKILWFEKKLSIAEQ